MSGHNPPPVLMPNDRFAYIGKTGSGKTTAAVKVTSALIDACSDRWQAQILWSKTDEKDQALFERFGFKKASRLGERGKKKVWIPVRPDTEYSVSDRMQSHLRSAIQRNRDRPAYTHTLVDEYTSAVLSTRNPGFWLKEGLVRGRGNKVGLGIGNQEPSDVPRTYMTQATHILIFDLFSNLDIAQIRKVFPEYKRPNDDFGFWYCWTTGPAIWHYYRDIDAFLGVA